VNVLNAHLVRVVFLAILLASCAPQGPGLNTASNRPGPVVGTLGAVFDMTPAYPGYPWTRDGHPVKPEELSTSAGPSHCGWQSATFLGIGWPVGTLSTSSAQARQYIRDPRAAVKASLHDRLELNAKLPSDARPTGYAYGSIQVYLSPTDQDEAVYLVGPSGAERWPRSDPMTLCE
jgi:hypothetical protein